MKAAILKMGLSVPKLHGSTKASLVPYSKMTQASLHTSLKGS